MSQDRPIVLYLGDDETGQWLTSALEPYEGYVCLPTELLPALGLYITYTPDLVILDARTMPDLAREVYLQLLTIDAESILILDYAAEDWDCPVESHIQVLTTFSRPVLLAAIGNMIGVILAVGEGA